MSEAASAGTTSTTGLSPLEPMLRDWLPLQRWFAGKGRRIGRLRMISAADLLPPGSSPGSSTCSWTSTATATSCCSASAPHCRPPWRPR